MVGLDIDLLHELQPGAGSMGDCRPAHAARGDVGQTAMWVSQPESFIQ